MTPQESQALQNFLDQLRQVRGIQKDPEAEAAIARAVAQQPDAAYLLVQRALLQDQAIESANAQISQLRNELQAGPTARTGSFLDPGVAWGRSGAVRPPQPEAQAPLMQAAPGPTPTQGSAAPPARPGFLGGGGGSFLGNMAATAAGVAGGAFLFHGIQNLMGQDQHGQNSAAQTDTTDTSAASAEPAHLADNSSMDADSGAFDDGGLGNMDFGGGDDGSGI